MCGDTLSSSHHGEIVDTLVVGSSGLDIFDVFGTDKLKLYKLSMLRHASSPCLSWYIACRMERELRVKVDSLMLFIVETAPTGINLQV